MLTPNLCSIADARLHLRADGDDADEWFAFWIPIVSDIIASWLGEDDPWRLYELQRAGDGELQTDDAGVPLPMIGADGAPIIHRLVRGAALVELADIYTNREGESRRFMEQAGNAGAGWGYTLCAGATAILQGVRKPRLA